MFIGTTTLFALIFSAPCLSGQTPQVSLKVGDVAPPLSLETVLETPASTNPTWQALRGKVVVLDFWATWCGPCVAAIPHLNALADELKDEPVQFIAIDDEEKWRVEKFLKIKPISKAIWIGLDRGDTTFDAYGVQARPHIVLIDAKGIVEGATSDPTRINESVIETLLAGKAPVLRSEQETPQPSPGPAAGQGPLLEAIVSQPSKSTSMHFYPGDFQASSLELKKAAAMAYGISPVRIIASTPLADQNYGFTIRLPGGQPVGPFLQDVLAAAFGLKVRRESREMNVLALVTPKSAPVALRPAKEQAATLSDSDAGLVSSRGTTLADFVSVLEETIGRIVVDETRIHGFYDLALYWDPKKPESVISAVRDQLGLELNPEKQHIGVLVIDRINAPTQKADLDGRGK